MKNSFEWLQPLIDALRTTDLGRPKAQAAFNRNLDVYPDSTIVRKTACHGAILGFVIGA
jgi:hypothetical protein